MNNLLQMPYRPDFFDELDAKVDVALALGARQRHDEREMELLVCRAASDPVKFLGSVKSWKDAINLSKKYPGNRATDSGDEDAYWRVNEVQMCVESGLTDVCQHEICGYMEGSHGLINQVCPVQPWNGEAEIKPVV